LPAIAGAIARARFDVNVRRFFRAIARAEGARKTQTEVLQMATTYLFPEQWYHGMINQYKPDTGDPKTDAAGLALLTGCAFIASAIDQLTKAVVEHGKATAPFPPPTPPAAPQAAPPSTP
jgi:hypothetical protein